MTSASDLGRKPALVHFLLQQTCQTAEIISTNHAVFPLYPCHHSGSALHDSTYYEKSVVRRATVRHTHILLFLSLSLSLSYHYGQS